MPDETLTTQTTPEAQQSPETAVTPTPPPAEAQTTDTGQEHMIPKSRFDEINNELKRLKAEQDKAAKAQSEAERKALEEQNKYKELYEKEIQEREKAMAAVKAMEMQNLRRDIAAKVGLPALLANRLRGETEEEITADANELLQTIPKQPAPNLDGGARNPKGDKPQYTDQQIKELAAQYGVSEKHLREQLGA